MAIVEDQARAVFFAALEHAPEQWPAYLDEACGKNEVLRVRVEQLLQAHQALGSVHGAPPETIDQPMSESAGTVVGPYKILEQIGEGGFGVVFLAEQTQPVRRKVALKILKPGMDTGQIVARFEAERQALAIMDHPNIAKVFDGGTTTLGRPYFVMELVRGVPITEFCDRNRGTPRQRLDLFVQVCQAVQHAHTKGIIHRDIKPSNVLVASHDLTPVVKVIDFGVAKALGQVLTEKTLFTGLAQMVGTPLYMSPEQAGQSNLDVDTRSDIYSLGVLLYELLTGSTPFDRDRFRQAAYDEIRRIIREEDPPRPSSRLSTSDTLPSVSAQRNIEPAKLTKLVRGELDWIVMKALEKDRNRRYETANGFAMDIQRYLADEPVVACPPSFRYRMGKLLRRNKGSILAASVVFLALLGGGVGGAFGLTESRKQQEIRSLKDKAELARDEAESAKRDAVKAWEKLAVVEYGRTMEVAHQEWRENNTLTTLALLDSTKPELRGWEWRYVNHLCHSHLVTLKGHTDKVTSATFSPNGARLATTSWDRTTKIWDTTSGSALLDLKGHTNTVTSVSFRPDGLRIVTASWDQTVRVWDSKTGEAILNIKAHPAMVLSASFSPDGSRLVTASSDRTARVWNAETGEQILTLKGHTGFVMSASFSPDGSRLVTASMDGTAKVWDARTGVEVSTLRGHNATVNSASFSHDGLQVVTASIDGTARLWDATSSAGGLILKGHTGKVASASFSPDGLRVVTAGYDLTARVWDAKTGAEILSLKGHTEPILSASFSPDGARLATASYDWTAKVWDARSGVEALPLKGHTDSVMMASFSPDGSQLVTASFDRTARIWDARTGVERLTLQGHADSLWSASFSPDGSRIVTAGSDRTARVWDARTGADGLIIGHPEMVMSASFSPDGSRLVTAGYDRTARVWDARTGAKLFSLQGHTAHVMATSFSSDGLYILTAANDRIAKVWDAKTGVEILALKGHTDNLMAASFSPDGLLVVTASVDQTAKVWDAKNGAEILTLKGHTNTVMAASFSPDGARLVTAGYDRTARVWDARTGAELLILKGHTGIVRSASFSPDGLRVVTASDDRTAKVWDATPVPRAKGPTRAREVGRP